MYSNTADWSSSREGQLRRLTSSFLSVAKNVSATALSYASLREPIETAIPVWCAARPNASETYWPPPRLGVLNGREVQPSFAGAQVGDVREPTTCSVPSVR